ncbi:MAG: metal-sensitive transcriptional regulator [Kiritimatiellae bacterium]|nr:metal-sensitive transcriptional regulator [Kiritimatiellia bacterium]
MKAKQKHTTTHEENLARLARIEGQVRGVRRMVEEGEYCIDIITQVQAVQSALGAVGRKILEKHLDTCVTNTLQSKSRDDMDEKLREVMKVMKRMCK